MNVADPPTLSFLTIDVDLRDRLAADPEGFAEAHGMAHPVDLPHLLDLLDQTLTLHALVPRAAPWGGYLALDPSARTIVGTCGYKTGPDHDGRVEIAYVTFPSFERRGYATAMARHLVETAENSPLAPIVRAHTLPERNASARILERLRFRRLGPAIDPDAGAVWLWERPRSR